VRLWQAREALRLRERLPRHRRLERWRAIIASAGIKPD
jgi:hypothetical protein